MTVLIVILILLAILLALTGIVGAIVPALPGPPLSYASLVLTYLACPEGAVTGSELLVWLFITVAVTVLDYVAPIWLTKLGGGSREAIWGSTWGILAGLFFAPIGLIVGPLLGAYIGEMTRHNDMGHALKVAAMSFVAFLLTTGLKLICSLLMTWVSVSAMLQWTHSFHLPWL